MITTISTLKSARDRWLGAGRDPRLLDGAVTALHAATTNTDVVKSLGSRYAVRSLGDASGRGRQQIYGIYADGELLLKYALHEVPPDADVEILP
jgi:hypothetical protein